MSRFANFIKGITSPFTDDSGPPTQSAKRARARERRRERYNSPDTAEKAGDVDRRVTVNEDVREALDGNTRTKPYDPVFLRDISANAVVQAYIDTLSQDVAGAEWAIRPRDEDADISDEMLAKVERRIRDLPPNNQTFRDVLESTTRVLLELGDAAMVKHYFEDKPDRVAELIPVDTASLFKIVDSHGITEAYVQVSRQGGTTKNEFDTSDVVWVEWSSRPDRFYGQGPLEKAQNEVELLEELAEKERLDLIQGGPPGVLSPEALDEYGGLPNDEDWDTFVENMRLDAGERHRVGYSKTPVQFESINHNYQELQILDRSKYWVTVLGSVFKVNPSYAGFDFENQNRATDESQRESFKQRGFRVTLRQLEEAINQSLVWEEFGTDVKFEFVKEQTVEERRDRAQLIEDQASAGQEMAAAGRTVTYRDGRLEVEDGEVEEADDGGGGLFGSTDRDYDPDDDPDPPAIEASAKNVPDSIVEQIGEDRFVPPEGAGSNAEEALRLIDEHGREEASGGTEEAIGRARQLIEHADAGDPLVGTNADGTPYVVEIANFFNRHRAQGNHEFDSDEYDAKYQDPGWLADMLWGGDAAEEWSTSLAEDIEAAEESDSKREDDPGDFVFESAEDALAAARELGFDVDAMGTDAIHLIDPDDVDGFRYMPGPSHEDLVDALAKSDDGVRLTYPMGGVAHSDDTQYDAFLRDVAQNGGRIIDTKGFSNGDDRVWPPDKPDAHDPRMVVYGLDEVDVLAVLDRYPDVHLQVDTDRGLNEKTKARERAVKADAILLRAFDRQIVPPSVDAIEKKAWTSDESVPEYVVDQIRTVIDRGAVFDAFESLPGRVSDVISDTLSDALTEPQGWSLDSITDRMSDALPRADPDDLETIARTESAKVLNEAREEGYRERGLDDAEFYWQGPDDSRTTDACEALKDDTNPSHGGTPVSLPKLIDKEEAVQAEHFPNLSFRKHTLHPNERHTFVRASGTGSDVDIDVDTPSAEEFGERFDDGDGDANVEPAELSAKDHADEHYDDVLTRVAKATNVTRRVGQIEDALGAPLPVILRECLESAGSTRGAHKELNRRLSEADDWDIDDDGKVSTATIYEWADRYSGHVSHLT